MKTTIALPLLLTSLFMIGCAQTPPTVKKLRIDPALLTLRPEPAAPKYPVTNRQDAQFKADIVDSARECRSKVEKIKNINEQR